MTGIAVFVEVHQGDLEALAETLARAGWSATAPSDPAEAGAWRCEIADQRMRWSPSTCPAAGGWEAVDAGEETAEHVCVVLASGAGRVLAKRTLDPLALSALQALLQSARPLAAAGSRTPTDRGGWRWRLVIALCAGLRLSLTGHSAGPLAGGDPPVLLGVAGILVGVLAGVDYLLTPAPREFYPWALAFDASWALLAVIALYVPARMAGRCEGLERVLVLAASAALAPLLVAGLYLDLDVGGRLADRSGHLAPLLERGLYWIWVGWLALVLLRAFCLGVPVGRGARVALGVYFVAVAAGLTTVPAPPVWVSDDADVAGAEGTATSGPPGASGLAEEGVDVEATYYAQPRLLEAALSRLAPQRPGVEDLYFVGFAGDAHEDVFMREVRNFQRFLDAERGTRHRSVLLINNPAVVGTVPLANRHNLALTLRRIGEMIDPDEDVVFLYLTSHGAEDGRFVVSFRPLRLTDLRPLDLEAMLAASRIRWQVVAVSACFSGAFIDPLRRPDTMVMTAARADRTSFGCESGRDYTYFGEALRTGLAQASSFPAAFDLARTRVTERERAEGKEPSYPQVSVGSEIAGRLVFSP